MKYLHTYLLLFLAALVLLTGCKTTDKTRLPDLRESYNYQDKRPFGAYIAHQQLAEMFRRNSIFEVNTNFEEGLGGSGFGKGELNPLGKVPEDFWEIAPAYKSLKEVLPFPTQKPEALLRKVILGSSNPGDVVLD